MLNKRVKEGLKQFHNENIKIKFCLGTIAIMGVCLLLLIISTFTQIKINFNMPESGIGNYLKFEYIPQIPILIFIAGLLGETWGFVVVLLYILMGLTPWFPIFALGGGLSYVFQYNFGYIFAYLFAVILCAKELNKGSSLKNILYAVLYGILTVHVIGTIYMVIIALIRHENFDFITNWIYYQSLSKILYDLVFGFLAIIIAKACHKILWLIMG